LLLTQTDIKNTLKQQLKNTLPSRPTGQYLATIEQLLLRKIAHVICCTNPVHFVFILCWSLFRRKPLSY